MISYGLNLYSKVEAPALKLYRIQHSQGIYHLRDLVHHKNYIQQLHFRLWIDMVWNSSLNTNFWPFPLQIKQ